MASCALLDLKTCQCSDYPNRTERVPDCLPLKPSEINDLGWLPPTCAYRRLAEGRGLSWWHPLISGTTETVHEAGVSVRGKAVSEELIAEEDLWGATVQWPLQDVG